ncbi:hypothetical protein Sru01_34570 [Sphaerisporangium rufum]|uniref:Membrane protein involved in the export of O-antigen and teichoic acid n=1 Tax=Sphaerisporangium rufum TaxID=1381558 RepID=A0A919R537_9ACTN|nr:hypothetical protein [Sphaerisporangium rufum]GII78475.1 hypothetical protein Sru01_34570 [Sphaerisporangium rufum]
MNAGRAAPRAPAVVALFAGRGAYRLGLYGSGVLLLDLWGAGTFAEYATATGVAGWLFALTSSGPEKAALTLVPRRGGAALEPSFARLAVLPFGLALLGWLAIAAAGPPGPAAVYAAACALACGVGSCTVLVALYRIRGRTRPDTAAYLAVAAAYGAAVAAVAWLGAGVHQVLALLVAVVAAVDAVLLYGLRAGRPARPPDAAGRPARRVARRMALRSALVLGVDEVAGTAGVALLYAALARHGDPVATSLFYALLLASAVVSTAQVYLLRIWQPRLVGWIEDSGGGGAVRAAGRILRPAAAAGAAATAGLAVLAVAAGPGRAVVLGVAAVVVEIALFAAAATAGYLMENLGAAGRRATARAAVVQLVVTGGAGWALVPVAGAAGGVLALCAGLVVKCALLAVSRPRDPEEETPWRAR